MLTLSPQFFDIFGTIGFVYILIIARMLLARKIPPEWMIVLLFLIGFVGLIVDISVVYTFYLK